MRHVVKGGSIFGIYFTSTRRVAWFGHAQFIQEVIGLDLAFTCDGVRPSDKLWIVGELLTK